MLNIEYFRRNPLLTAILVNIVLFSVVFIFCFPVFNSGDDVFLLYLMSGGFGDPPTELLHYHYGMHPYLGLFLKNLFTDLPGVNWYAYLLYLFHFTACVVILWQQLKKNLHWSTWLGYALLFLAIETRFLLQPSFTNTALVTAAAGMLLVLNGFTLTGYLLVLLSTMLRLHLIIPVAVIAAPFFFLVLNKKTRRRFLLDTIAAVALIVAFVMLQERYYKNHIPGWQQEEAYRQATIDYYNSPKIIATNLPDSIKLKAAALDNGMLWDSKFLSAEQITAVRKAVSISGTWQYKDFGERVYWLFMEHRLELLVLLLMLGWRFSSASLTSSLLFGGLCTSLLLFKKLPAYIVTGGILQLLAFSGVTGSTPKSIRPLKKWLFVLFAGLLLAWSVVRIYKTSKWNREQHGKFLCAYKDVSSRPDKLFVVTDDKFPMDYFHVWKDPQQYKLPNLLYRDHFQNNVYQSAYSRFHIEPTLGLANGMVRFSGNDSLLVNYFNRSLGEVVSAIPVDSSACLKLTIVHPKDQHKVIIGEPIRQ